VLLFLVKVNPLEGSEPLRAEATLELETDERLQIFLVVFLVLVFQVGKIFAFNLKLLEQTRQGIILTRLTFT